MLEAFKKIRKNTVKIIQDLDLKILDIQSSLDVSPPKWHLAHTTWFFEVFVLKKFIADYQQFSPDANSLFNSYYHSLGATLPKQDRGILTRQTVSEILEYRDYVDRQIVECIERNTSLDLQKIILLGLAHEEQHQELLLMDAKHILFSNDVLDNKLIFPVTRVLQKKSEQWCLYPSALYDVGVKTTDSFCFDNEKPAHKVYLEAFEISTNLVSNRDYLNFIEQGGYQNFELWYSDGWDWVQQNKIAHPLYWQYRQNEWCEFLSGSWQRINLDQPVSHINYYEASAFARFKNFRLPTEFEWEVSIKDTAGTVNQVWEWTSSSYQKYPGHIWQKGAIGEYNSKFMVNQIVLRGGSVMTPSGHTRPTYRNFYRPEKRWVMSGFRLARDVC